MTNHPARSHARPQYEAPQLSCDAHCHVFGPGDIFPYAPGRSYTPADAPKEALAALHDALGIERAVIVQESCHGSDNRAMLDAIAWRPDRYRGVAIVDDSFDDRALQALDDGGVRGGALQLRPPSRRRTGQGRLRSRDRPHQGARLACGAAHGRQGH